MSISPKYMAEIIGRNDINRVCRMIDESCLVRDAKAGSEYAMAQLLQQNYTIVFRYLLKFTLNKEAAEDMTQDAMVKAIEKLYLYQPEKSKFSTWMITVAQHTYLDELRRRKREWVSEEVAEYSPAVTAPLLDESLQALLDALAAMPEEIRVPVVLKHYYGYSYDEIGKLMKIPAGTVKSRIHNAMGKLRKELAYNG